MIACPLRAISAEEMGRVEAVRSTMRTLALVATAAIGLSPLVAVGFVVVMLRGTLPLPALLGVCALLCLADGVAALIVWRQFSGRLELFEADVMSAQVEVRTVAGRPDLDGLEPTSLLRALSEFAGRPLGVSTNAQKAGHAAQGVLEAQGPIRLAVLPRSGVVLSAEKA